jgi:hypothetical protein
MAMGKRKQREKQEDLWIAHTELAKAPGHPFCPKLNESLFPDSMKTNRIRKSGQRKVMNLLNFEPSFPSH